MSLYLQNNIKIYNSLSGEKEPFSSINVGKIGMYVCGPTVYSNVHLGNVRTFMSFDVIFRYFLHLGYKVRYVRNITDVGHIVDDEDEGEDKIAKKARLEALEPMEVVGIWKTCSRILAICRDSQTKKILRILHCGKRQRHNISCAGHRHGRTVFRVGIWNVLQ